MKVRQARGAATAKAKGVSRCDGAVGKVGWGGTVAVLGEVGPHTLKRTEPLYSCCFSVLARLCGVELSWVGEMGRWGRVILCDGLSRRGIMIAVYLGEETRWLRGGGGGRAVGNALRGRDAGMIERM